MPRPTTVCITTTQERPPQATAVILVPAPSLLPPPPPPPKLTRSIAQVGGRVPHNDVTLQYQHFIREQHQREEDDMELSEEDEDEDDDSDEDDSDDGGCGEINDSDVALAHFILTERLNRQDRDPTPTLDMLEY